METAWKGHERGDIFLVKEQEVSVKARLSNIGDSIAVFQNLETPGVITILLSDYAEKVTPYKEVVTADELVAKGLCKVVEMGSRELKS